MAYEMPCKEIFVRISARFGDILNIFANFAVDILASQLTYYLDNKNVTQSQAM